MRQERATSELPTWWVTDSYPVGCGKVQLVCYGISAQARALATAATSTPPPLMMKGRRSFAASGLAICRVHHRADERAGRVEEGDADLGRPGALRARGLRQRAGGGDRAVVVGVPGDVLDRDRDPRDVVHAARRAVLDVGQQVPGVPLPCAGWPPIT